METNHSNQYDFVTLGEVYMKKITANGKEREILCSNILVNGLPMLLLETFVNTRPDGSKWTVVPQYKGKDNKWHFEKKYNFYLQLKINSLFKNYFDKNRGQIKEKTLESPYKVNPNKDFAKPQNINSGWNMFNDDQTDKEDLGIVWEV